MSTAGKALLPGQRLPKEERGEDLKGKLTFAALAAASAMSLALAATAVADVTICSAGSAAGQCENPQGVAVDTETGRLYVADRGNRRIDVFDPGPGHAFAFGFGWGVANGAPELQSCGPKATPPANCQKGLGGGGAGAMEGITDIAVDNDPASPSHQDVYVLDGRRIQKFDSEGNFILTWGGGVISGGASGTGDLTSGSSQIASVQTTAKRFAVGQTVTGAGIPAETKILALGENTITLSKAATASGSGVALSVAEGVGNIPANEIDRLVNNGSGSPNFAFTTVSPNPPPLQTELGQLPNSTTCLQLQAAFEALSNVGAGNVACTGENVAGEIHEYTVEFKGGRYADTDVALDPALSTGIRTVITEENGGGAAEICTAAIAVSCSAGIDGDGEGQFAESPHLALGPGGVVHVVDCVRPASSASCENRLQKFEPSGAPIEELVLAPGGDRPEGFAVNSSGQFYVSVNSTIRKYDAAGNLLKQLPDAEGIGALVVDGVDHLFAAERDRMSVIAEYDAADATVRRFGYGLIQSQPNGLAHYPVAGEDIYSAEGDSVIYREFAPPGPILAPQPCAAERTGNLHATLEAEINPEGKETKFFFEYGTEEEGEGGFIKSPDATMTQSDFFLHTATIKVQGLTPETKYLCRAVAKNADGETVPGPVGKFTTRNPVEFGAAWSANVGEEEATVFAEANPLGAPASGQIEYVEDAKYNNGGKFAEALSAPTPELDYGSSEEMTLREVTLSGLKPGTVYHYRLRVRNEALPEGVVCPHQEPECPELEHTFRTYLPEADEADQRRYELVSPGEKNSAEVAVPGNAAGFLEPRFIRILAGSGSGEALTYTSWTSFGEAEGAQGTSQYLSRRTAGGWATESIAPKGYLWSPVQPPFVGFSPDLRYGAFRTTEPVLVEGCLKGIETLYLRDNETGEVHCLLPDLPDAPKQPCPVYAGVSADGSQAFFAGKPEGADNFEYSLYEWTKADGKVQPVSVFPNGEVAPATKGTHYGAAGERFAGAENCDVARRIVRHAVSEDGSRAFWTYAPNDESKRTELFVRVDGSETIQLDRKESGVKEDNSGDGVFWAANADGSVAYFTAPRRLVSGANPKAGEPDLYRYQFGQASPLSDITKGSGPADVRGVVGISDDGSYVYFVAGAVLSADANEAGQVAEAGKSNLYLHHEDETSFIATLAGQADGGVWSANPREMRARVSPDGRHLGFLSIEAEKLASYDNTIATGEHCQYNPTQDGKLGLAGGPLCPQAFLYAADSGELTCASCNPSGSRPLGPTVVPGWSNGYEGPRFLSDDGSRLFFQTFDRLLQTDESGLGDVYEFERPGQGSCGEANPNFDPVSGGCHFLISSGRSGDETYLVDAAADGRDVFFSTRQPLVGWDVNPNFDVYDFREGGGFPEPPEPPHPCTSGESCKAPPASAPAPPSPATPNQTGPGNPKAPKPCKKGFVRKGKKCVKKHQGKGKGSQHKNKRSAKRGAGR
jgi:hypothetical protein